MLDAETLLLIHHNEPQVVKGDVVDTTGWSGKSGTQATSNILSRTTYTLDCLKTDNTHLRESTVVNIVPVFEEK